DGPLDVLRASIVTLDLARHLAQPVELRIAHAARTPPLGRDLGGLDIAAGGATVLDVLVGHLAHADLAGDLAHHPAVGRDFAAHHRGSQAPRAFDGNHRAIPGGRAAREHHAGRARLHHGLHHHRHRNFTLGDAAVAPVTDRFHRIETGPAIAHALQHARTVGHP